MGLVLVFALAEVLVLALSLTAPWVVFLSLIGIGFLYWISKKTFLGLCILILLHYFVIRGTEEVSPEEVLFAVSFVAILGSWFFKKIFLERQAIVLDVVDYALLGFLGLCVLSIVPALIFGSSPLKWLREFVPFLTLLLIFPIREQVDSPKRMKILIGCFLLLSLGVAIHNAFSYRQAVARALQLWELTASRQSFNASFFMAITIAASAFLVLGQSKLEQSLALLTLTVSGIALVVTFSRGYWVGTIAGLATLLWFLPGKSKGRMLTYLGVVGVTFTAVVMVFLGDIADFVLDVVLLRFNTIGEAIQDPSFLNRLTEAQAVFAQIKENPIVGYGLGKTYSYDANLPIEMPTWYVHNTALFVWYKVGLFGLLSLGVFMIAIFLQCVRAWKAETNSFLKTLLLGLKACLVGMILVSFSSPQFIEKDTALLGALVVGLIQSISRRQARR